MNYFRKKRFWFLLLLLFYLAALQMEWAKNRYDALNLADTVESITQKSAHWSSKSFDTQTMTYLRVGDNPNLPILLMVHGSPGSLLAYEDYYTDTDLLEQFTIIAIDRLGFGFADFGKAEPHLSNHAKLIAAILEDYPNQKKILVGHSMGGPVIAKTAMEYPHLVDGLVLIAPSISPLLEPSNTWRKILNFLPIRICTPDALRICNQEIIPLKNELELMLDDWAGINIPVTVIQGTEDSLVPEGNADFAKSVLTNSPHVDIQKINGGNHFILWSELSFIKKAFLKILEQLD